MSDRATQIADFLQDTPWAAWHSAPLPADASSRRYLRLTDGANRVIVMDADPDTGQEIQRFIHIANWLTNAGFSAPKILRAKVDQGLLVLDDLGHHDFADWIDTHPNDATTLYSTAADVLTTLDHAPVPNNLPVMSAETAGEMLHVTCAWYAHATDPKALATTMSRHMTGLCGPPNRVALRDFHLENLIWRSGKQGIHRVGLLDFQDAFIAPRGYDLASLLRDVRRNVDPGIAAKVTDQFITATQADPEQMTDALACLAVQRNLRILGVFARLALRDDKRRYLNWVPHVWALIQEDLQHPALQALKAVVDDSLPPPDQSAIKDLI